MNYMIIFVFILGGLFVYLEDGKKYIYIYINLLYKFIYI